jgi:hypothetical protein
MHFASPPFKDRRAAVEAWAAAITAVDVAVAVVAVAVSVICVAVVVSAGRGGA